MVGCSFRALPLRDRERAAPGGLRFFRADEDWGVLSSSVAPPNGHSKASEDFGPTELVMREWNPDLRPSRCPRRVGVLAPPWAPAPVLPEPSAPRREEEPASGNRFRKNTCPLSSGTFTGLPKLSRRGVS